MVEWCGLDQVSVYYLFYVVLILSNLLVHPLVVSAVAIESLVTCYNCWPFIDCFFFILILLVSVPVYLTWLLTLTCSNALQFSLGSCCIPSLFSWKGLFRGSWSFYSVHLVLICWFIWVLFMFRLHLRGVFSWHMPQRQYTSCFCQIMLKLAKSLLKICCLMNMTFFTPWKKLRFVFNIPCLIFTQLYD